MLRREILRSTGSLLRALALMLFFPVFLVVSLPLAAQVVTVSVQGRIYDSTGAAISGADVSAVNAATGFSRSVLP